MYYNPRLKSDHSACHNEEWREALCGSCLEAGTITQLNTVQNGMVTVTVRWDCGVEKDYSSDLWQYLRVYSLGPAGMVFTMKMWACGGC